MVSVTAIPDAIPVENTSSFAATCNDLCEFLIQTTLIDSYHSFAQHAKSYPFAKPESLRPGANTASYEHPFQRSALVLLVDGMLPINLRKHIRYRRANELNEDNLARLAPEIARDHFPPIGLSLDHEMFSALLDRLLDVDYALLMQRPTEAAAISLSHMHVKVERLTDNAVRVLARDLGYIRRTLIENGEVYAETLERKYFEYFGFAANASGRKCAAAMAAQLLSAEEARFTVFATCQEDCRLTMLDSSDMVTHHMLLMINPNELTELGAVNVHDYIISSTHNGCVVCYRAQFRRTSHAQPRNPNPGPRSEMGLGEPWLEINAETIIPLPGRSAAPLSYSWL